MRAPFMMIGAGAIVTEGKDFPERSMILGAPAKAVREVEPDFVKRIVRVSASYVENAKRFRQGLRRIS